MKILNMGDSAMLAISRLFRIAFVVILLVMINGCYTVVSKTSYSGRYYYSRTVPDEEEDEDVAESEEYDREDENVEYYEDDNDVVYVYGYAPWSLGYYPYIWYDPFWDFCYWPSYYYPHHFGYIGFGPYYYDPWFYGGYYYNAFKNASKKEHT